MHTVTLGHSHSLGQSLIHARRKRKHTRKTRTEPLNRQRRKETKERNVRISSVFHSLAWLQFGILGGFRKWRELTNTANDDSRTMTPIVKPSGIAMSTLKLLVASFPLASIAVTL